MGLIFTDLNLKGYGTVFLNTSAVSTRLDCDWNQKIRGSISGQRYSWCCGTGTATAVIAT
jgi:hypothetical protein